MKTMKKAPCVVLLCITVGAGCGKNLRTGEGQERWHLGWVDESSFRVRAVGAIRGSAGAARSPRLAAVEMAKKIVVENFTAARFNAIHDGARQYRDIREEVAREFSGVIHGGKVVSSDTGYGNICTIIYEVRGDRLRKKVLRGQLPEEK